VLVDFFGRADLQHRPWLITAMREAMAMASSWSCVTITQVTPTDSMMLTSSNCVRSRSFLSSAPSGSSSSSSCGFLARLRASATRCCCPPESWCGLRLAKVSSCTSLSISCTAPRSHQAWAMPSRLSPKAMLSHTLRCGNSAYDWNIMLMGRSYGGKDGDVHAVQDHRAGVGVSKPASMRSKVDLPQPELPSSAKISPRVDRDRHIVDRHHLVEALDQRSVRKKPSSAGRGRFIKQGNHFTT
jgi:hypothetical protein